MRIHRNFKVIAFIFIVLITLAKNVFAENTCINIIGKWQGSWFMPYARCSFDASVTATDSNGTIILDVVRIGHDSVIFPNVACKDEHDILIGTCQGNIMHLKSIYWANVKMEGYIEKNKLRLDSDADHAFLEKISI